MSLKTKYLIDTEVLEKMYLPEYEDLDVSSNLNVKGI